MKKFSLLICLSLVLTVSAFPQTLKSAIAAIGCKQIKPSNIKPMSITGEELKQWLDGFKIQSKQSFLAKCGNYRYLFEAETFVNETDARARLPRISEIPPKENDKSDLSVPILLREGFRVKNKIYTVGAFAVFLKDNGQVRKFRDKLARKIN